MSRIQRRRTKGWQMPEGAIYVGRPSKWGNPFTIAGAIDVGFASTEDEARALAVECFEDVIQYGRAAYWWFEHGAERIDWIRAHVLDQPCHADVLLKYANGGDVR